MGEKKKKRDRWLVADLVCGESMDPVRLGLAYLSLYVSLWSPMVGNLVFDMRQVRGENKKRRKKKNENPLS